MPPNFCPLFGQAFSLGRTCARRNGQAVCMLLLDWRCCTRLCRSLPSSLVNQHQQTPTGHRRASNSKLHVTSPQACFSNRPVDVCKSWSKHARYPQNTAFVPRRFSTPLGVTKNFRVFAPRRFHTALCITSPSLYPCVMRYVSNLCI